LLRTETLDASEAYDLMASRLSNLALPVSGERRTNTKLIKEVDNV
jgi:hypothetical protein